MGSNITWKFKYKNKEFRNVLRDVNEHGDFLFTQNGNYWHMDQCGERYFLPILIYGMQKIKSPEKTKADLEKKDYIKGAGFHIESSNDGARWYFQPIFLKLDKFNEFKIKNSYEREKIIKIDRELKTFNELKEEIILPYSQLSKTVDKLIIASKNALFRTDHEDLSKMIDYYVSGEFEKDFEKLNSPSI